MPVGTKITTADNKDNEFIYNNNRFINSKGDSIYTYEIMEDLTLQAGSVDIYGSKIIKIENRNTQLYMKKSKKK